MHDSWIHPQRLTAFPLACQSQGVAAAVALFRRVAGGHCPTSQRARGGVKRSTAPFSCGESSPWNFCQLTAGCTPLVPRAFTDCPKATLVLLRQHCTFAPHLLSKSSYLQPVSSGFDSKVHFFFFETGKR